MIIGGYDTETTGLNDPEHRIIEACVIRYELDPVTFEARELDSYVQRYDPQRSIDAKAQAVHDITSADLVGKPLWKDAAPALVAALDSCQIVVAHNGFDFDFPFTIRELDRVGLALPDFEPFDTMTSGRWATPFGKAPSLAELSFSCGVPYDPSLAHAAEYDVRVMMASFFHGLRRGVFTLSA